MKQVMNILLLVPLTIICNAQTISNVQFEQVNDKVKITYTLDKIADISISISTDGGRTWSYPLQNVSGDVKKKVSAGRKIIWWDVLSERESLIGDNICFKVFCSTQNAVVTKMNYGHCNYIEIYQAYIQKYGNPNSQNENELKIIQAQILEQIEIVAAEKGLVWIFDSSALAYIGYGANDITTEVIHKIINNKQ